MNIKFSIIMPTFNRKHCIKNAIDSVLAQTYQNFELIIIDDGSTDGTCDYLNDLYENELLSGKIKIFSLSQNKGAAFARNKGLEMSCNDWIAYLDTDNVMHQDFLETFVDVIKKNPSSKIFYAKIQKMKSKVIVGRYFDFCDLILGNYIDLGVFISSTDIYKQLGNFDDDLKRLIDWDLIVRFTDKYDPIFIDKVLLDYYDGNKFSRISNNNVHNESYKKIVLNYYESLSPDDFIVRYQEQVERKEKEIRKKNHEIELMKSSKFWKMREKYLILRNLFRNNN